jgi:hypothetical protein
MANAKIPSCLAYLACNAGGIQDPTVPENYLDGPRKDCASLKLVLKVDILKLPSGCREFDFDSGMLSMPQDLSLNAVRLLTPVHV